MLEINMSNMPDNIPHEYGSQEYIPAEGAPGSKQQGEELTDVNTSGASFSEPSNPSELIRSLAISTAELWQEVLQRLDRLESSQSIMSEGLEAIKSSVSALGSLDEPAKLLSASPVSPPIPEPAPPVLAPPVLAPPPPPLEPESSKPPSEAKVEDVVRSYGLSEQEVDALLAKEFGLGDELPVGDGLTTGGPPVSSDELEALIAKELGTQLVGSPPSPSPPLSSFQPPPPPPSLPPPVTPPPPPPPPGFVPSPNSPPLPPHHGDTSDFEWEFSQDLASNMEQNQMMNEAKEPPPPPPTKVTQDFFTRAKKGFKLK